MTRSSRLAALVFVAIFAPSLSSCGGTSDNTAVKTVTISASGTTTATTEKSANPLPTATATKTVHATVTATATQVAPAPSSSASESIPGDGIWLVGTDIRAGTYRNQGSGSCYWARLSGTSGNFEEIIANGNSSGQVIVTIDQGDAAFETARCGTWNMITGAPAPAAGVTAKPWPGTSLSTQLQGQVRNDVEMVQSRLNDLGYGPMPVDGDYGPVTQSWVRAYQSDYGLYVDGVVGPVTWKSLFD